MPVDAITYEDVIDYFSTSDNKVSVDEMTEFLIVTTPKEIDLIRKAILEERAKNYSTESVR